MEVSSDGRSVECLVSADWGSSSASFSSLLRMREPIGGRVPPDPDVAAATLAIPSEPGGESDPGRGDGQRRASLMLGVELPAKPEGHGVASWGGGAVPVFAFELTSLFATRGVTVLFLLFLIAVVSSGCARMGIALRVSASSGGGTGPALLLTCWGEGVSLRRRRCAAELPGWGLGCGVGRGVFRGFAAVRGVAGAVAGAETARRLRWSGVATSLPFLLFIAAADVALAA